VTKPHARPRLKVLHCLGGLGSIQISQWVLPSDQADDLDIDDLGRGLIAVGTQAVANGLSRSTANYHLTET
jgi:hypothetical protein